MIELLNGPRIETYKRLFQAGNFDFVTVNPIHGKNFKQELALTKLIDTITTELAYGGAAGGAKSWTGCVWQLFMCLLYPGVKGFIGRESLKDIRDSTLVTFYKVAKQYGLKPNVDYKYNGQDNFIYFPNESRIDLLNLEYMPSDPMYERLGSKEYTFGFLEECGQIHFNAFDVLKTRIGRHLNDKYGIKAKLFLTFNPKKNWIYSYFVKPSEKGLLAPYQFFIRSLFSDNTHRESDYEERLRSITDKVQRARLLEGNFDYDDDPTVLIPYDSILNLFTNDFVPTGSPFITADIARFGKDTTKIALWSGWRVEQWHTLEGKKVTQIAEFIRSVARQNRVPMQSIVADEDGVGGGVVDILGCQGFVNNSRPLPYRIQVSGKKQDENYANLRSQCWFKLAEKLVANEVYFGVRLPEEEKELLNQQLAQIKDRTFDSDGKKEVSRKIEIKDAIRYSPDDADTLMMRYYFELQPKSREMPSWDYS